MLLDEYDYELDMEVQRKEAAEEMREKMEKENLKKTQLEMYKKLLKLQNC